VITALVDCIQNAAEEAAKDAGSIPGVLDLTPSFLAKCAHASVAFATWRATLLTLPPGLDPAMMAFEEQNHVKYVCDEFVSPRLRVMRASQRMPLLPDATSEIADLEKELEEAEEKCHRLEESCIPRPVPPQYIPLASEVQHCAQTMLPDARNVASLMYELTRPKNEFDTSHASSMLSECDKKMAALLSWADRIEGDYLLYADQFSPFLLAVRDVNYGLSLLSTALQQMVQQHRFSALRDPSFLRSCFQYPIVRSRCSTGFQPFEEAAAACSSPDVTSALKTAVIERLSAESMSEKLSHALPRILAVQMQLKGQMMQLRMCGLLGIRRSQEVLQACLGHIVTLWNVAKELQEELQQREESMFKSSSQMDQCALFQVIMC
jgi:hypothetical protein